MADNDPELSQLSDDELGEHIRYLRAEVAAYQVLIEPDTVASRRSWKLVRGTILLVGGLVGATFDAIGFVMVFLGAWEWVEGIADDAATYRRQLAMRRELTNLEARLIAATAELQKRMTQ